MAHESQPDSESRLAAAVDSSRVLALGRALDDRLSGIGTGARTQRIADWTRRAVTGSFVYRWLTADPDPEVVVIDLRETRTVGPVVAVLDRLLAWGARAMESSRTAAVSRGLLAEFRAAPIRLGGITVAAACASGLLLGLVGGALSPPSVVILAVLAVAGLAGTRVTASWADLRTSRIGRLLGPVFDPPVSEASTAPDRDFGPVDDENE